MRSPLHRMSYTYISGETVSLCDPLYTACRIPTFPERRSAYAIPSTPHVEMHTRPNLLEVSSMRLTYRSIALSGTHGPSENSQEICDFTMARRHKLTYSARSCRDRWCKPAASAKSPFEGPKSRYGPTDDRARGPMLVTSWPAYLAFPPWSPHRERHQSRPQGSVACVCGCAEITCFAASPGRARHGLASRRLSPADERTKAHTYTTNRLHTYTDDISRISEKAAAASRTRTLGSLRRTRRSFSVTPARNRSDHYR
ncbi:hypothetical protein GGS23DRAFT_410602 [Durotheca rogersii]|uniref:uncharacterized protein n=1 Tax=Durotheca rogersii TaxID=419775 RepID=UPI002220A644|nr:uncharacterized protein GGS23DRAFT_410602 [Durotheca rogersii]KAI5865120.1 hypothetical protein GGS23DRAFT_410602 [Durotheca rogersii]